MPHGRLPDDGLLTRALVTGFALLAVALGGPVAASAQAPLPTLSVADISVLETTSTTTAATATFTVSLSAPATAPVTVDYTTAAGTATAPADFASTSGSVSFAVDDTEREVTVPVVGDALDEPDETFWLELSSADGATILDDAGRATIEDDDFAPTVTVTDVSGLEGTNSGTVPTALTFQVKLSAASSRTITVQADTLAGTAEAVVTPPLPLLPSGDYTAREGVTVEFAPGETSKPVAVQLRTDNVNEPDETFALRVSTPVNATIVDLQAATGTGTILNDDVTLSVADVTVTEGTSATATPASFLVSLSGPSSSTVTVNYSTVNTSASAPADYQTKNGVLVFLPGETEKSVAVSVIADATDEDPETFSLQLSSVVGTPMNANILDGIGVATIADDDDPPTLSAGDASITEGTGSNRTLVFTVSLSAASSRQISFLTAVEPGTAVAVSGEGSAVTGDYVPRTTAPTSMSAGLTQVTVSVSIRADTEDEADETLKLVLSNPSNATLLDAEGTGTILDDDGPVISVADLTVAEGATGQTVPAKVRVSLSAASPQDVKVNYASTNDTATAGQDYEALPTGQVLTISAGQTSATVDTVVKGDDLDENDEKYRVTVSSPVNGTTTASGADPIGVVTITDDDASPNVQVAGVTVAEGTGGTSTATLKVNLSAASGRTLLAGYATKDGTAKAGVDYQQAAELLTFNPGDTSKTISIPIAPDAEVEENESFEAFVFNASAGSDGVSPVTITIVDDDLTDQTRPVLSVSDVTVTREGDTGATGQARFIVTLDRPLARRVAVAYDTVPGSASAPDDFQRASGTLVFAPQERSQIVTVTTMGDTTLEFNQDFRLILADPVNARLGDASGLGIITDDDVGGGPLAIGARSATGRPADRVRLRDLLCARKARCAGLPVAWRVANPGAVSVEVVGLVPAKPARGRTKATKARRITMVQLEQRLRTAGAGTLAARRPAGRGTERIARSVRSAKVRTIRVTMRFTNRFGGRDETVKELRLVLSRLGVPRSTPPTVG